MNDRVNNREKIEDLIEQTTDPTQRAMLLVLAQLDSALWSNTKATDEIATDFKEHRVEFRNHVDEERKIMASVKGAWWSGLIFIGLVQILVAFILSRYVLQNDQQDLRLAEHERRLIILEYQVRAVTGGDNR